MKKPLDERMEDAGLGDLMPGFDREAEWTKLHTQLHPARQRRVMPLWLRAAAVLLLLAGGSYVVWQLTNEDTAVAQEMAMTDTGAQEQPDGDIQGTNSAEIPANGNEAGTTLAATANDRKPPVVATSNVSYKPAGEFVCNGTPCPLEICIIQSIKCQNEQPTAISTCSILEPNQAHQLRYRLPQSEGEHCKVTVDEIRIRRVTTGETIVLNAHSKPSTAEELFACLTGQEDKCNLLAGMFHADCDNEQKTHSLKIGTDFGNVVVH